MQRCALISNKASALSGSIKSIRNSITNLCVSLLSSFIFCIFYADQEFPTRFILGSDIFCYLSPIKTIMESSLATNPDAKEHKAGKLLALKSKTFGKEW